MATRPTEALTVIPQYNIDAYDEATNPYGFDNGGHIYNHLQSFRYIVQIEQYITELTGEFSALMAAAVAEIDADAQAVEQARQQIVTKAAEAATSATNAKTSETNAANSAAALVATSTTSVAIGTGAKTFTVQAGRQWGVGNRLTITNDAAPASRIMYGTVTAYSGTSVTVSVDNIVGSGTYAAWTLRLSGDRGATGLTGNTGPLPFTSPPTVWASDVAYVVGPPASAVTYLGETFICISAHTSSASITPTDMTRWRRLAAKGADGLSPGVADAYALNLHFGS